MDDRRKPLTLRGPVRVAMALASGRSVTIAGRRVRRARASAPTASWLIAVPAVLAVLALLYGPTVAGALYAFTDWPGIGAAHWVGFRNFSDLAHDPAARGAVWNTLRLALGFVVLANAIGLALALGLNRSLKSRFLLRALFFAPVVVSPVAIGYLWQYILQSNGALNTILSDIGLGTLRHDWLGDPTTARWSILVAMLWQLSGLTMIIYLAGLAAVPDEYYEAAAVDGASPWHQFRKITIPALAPAIAINSTLGLLVGLRVFDQVIALTNGGPANATQTLATEIYVQAFTLGRFGYSTSIALVLTVLILVLMAVRSVLLRPRSGR
jgi:raffinose/stachyose/melibiose transport system permease protein